MMGQLESKMVFESGGGEGLNFCCSGIIHLVHKCAYQGVRNVSFLGKFANRFTWLDSRFFCFIIQQLYKKKNVCREDRYFLEC